MQSITSSPSPYFEPSKGYLDSLSALVRNGDRARLRSGVTQMARRASQARDVAERNRLWFDAVNILGRSWQRDARPALLDRQAIHAAQHRLLEVEADDVPPELQALTDEVLAESWESFAAFQASSAGAVLFDLEAEDWLGPYDRWLSRYLPCLMIGLPADPEQADAVIAERAEWMVSKVVPPQQDPFGHREGLIDRIWRYAMRHWKVAPDGGA
jgi:hypothetical protein